MDVSEKWVKLFSRVRLFVTPGTVAYQAPLSMGFSRQENWSRLPFPSPGDLPDPGIEPQSPTLQADALTSEPPGKPWMWELDYKESWAPKNCCFWTMVLEKTLESPLDCKEIQPVNPKRKLVLNTHWKDWCWSWNPNTLATWCEELTHWKRPWFWERLRAGGEGDDRGEDGWMASPTQWTWIWEDSGSWWWTRRPGVLRFMGSQRVGHDWVTELNWTDATFISVKQSFWSSTIWLALCRYQKLRGEYLS